jgi:enamine deaminase RidA (YjgF/YER057c/UK114 family)
MQAISEFFGESPTPASSLIGVSALMYPELMIEIDTIAATGE